jgi:hypothetical protein
MKVSDTSPTSRQPWSMTRTVASVRHRDGLCDAGVLALLLEDGIGDGRRAVLSFSLEMISIGPRSGFLKLALAARGAVHHRSRLDLRAGDAGRPVQGDPNTMMISPTANRLDSRS